MFHQDPETDYIIMRHVQPVEIPTPAIAAQEND